jgi:hypothetical protein
MLGSIWPNGVLKTWQPCLYGSGAALPDGVFLSQIWRDLAFLEVIWRFYFSFGLYPFLYPFWRFFWHFCLLSGFLNFIGSFSFFSGFFGPFEQIICVLKKLKDRKNLPE